MEAASWALFGLLALVVAAGFVALRAWRRDRRALAAALERARDYEAQAAAGEAEAARSRDALETVERSRLAVREWADELRDKLNALQEERGTLGSTQDTPALVLRVALRLMEARGGMLLSRCDDDGDGRLDLEHSEGIDDPENHDLAQTLAHRVLDRDETLRTERAIAIPIYIHDRFDGVLVAEGREGGFEDLQDEVLLALGDHAGMALHNSRLRGQLRGAYLGTIAALADALAAKDPQLAGHSGEVARYVAAVSERLEVDRARREALVFASVLHDVGKIGISERILLKPGPLSDEERAVVELHPRIGYKLLERVPELSDVSLAVLHHHERFDGNGYPGRLKGERIPLEARIVGVADAFSAMVSDRSYRGALSVPQACDELQAGAGTQFDPVVVSAFLDEIRRRPPSTDSDGEFRSLLDDPELALHRTDGELVLGAEVAALIDPTTGLYSRRHLEDALRAETQRAGVQGNATSVVLVEIGALDAINRVQGPAAGDAALREAAGLLREIAVATHATACRHAGRRFALVVPRADEDAAERVATMVRGALPERLAVRVACTTAYDGEQPHDLLVRAREALGA